MIRSLYQAASAMMAQMSRQLSISNNLSNATTPGYKAEIGTVEDFRDMLLNRIVGDDAREVGSLSTAVRLDQPQIDLAQGALVDTGNALDLAIAGDAFFAVRTPDGVQYTRNGSFHLDAQRTLVTSDGLPVLGEDGPITVPEGEIYVDPDGTVRAGGQVAGRLQLIAFDPNAEVQPVGNGRYAIAGQGRPSATAGVSQGFLEQSNVDLTQQMVDMLSASRSYALAQQMFQISDDSLRMTVNDVGRVA